MKKKSVKAVLGTMTFAGQTNQEDSLKQINYFFDRHPQKSIVELDTAYLYENTKTESLLGEILLPEHRSRLAIATKANPHGKMSLRAEHVIEQLNTSLENLKMDQVKIFYLHSPDHKTPLEETLKACQTLYEQGKFRELGLSNYPAWQVAEIFNLCKHRNWVTPSVYQGMYNSITRDVERELIPCIRHYKMRFYAYNPLAGGFLTGKYHDFELKPQEGRFRLKPFYQGRFWKESFFNAVSHMRNYCYENELSLTDVNISWLRNHSALEKGDAIIFGQSKFEQLEQNMKAYESEKLSAETLKVIQEANNMCKVDCPQYFK